MGVGEGERGAGVEWRKRETEREGARVWVEREGGRVGGGRERERCMRMSVHAEVFVHRLCDCACVSVCT